MVDREPLPAAGITVYFRLLTDTCTIVVGSDITEINLNKNKKIVYTWLRGYDIYAY